MDKEKLASSSLSLPLATLCILTQTEAPLKVKVLCWVACLLPLSLGPSHRHTFYLTIDWPGSLPLLPTFPDPHPPPSKPDPARLSHAVGAYVFHLDSSPTPLCLWIPWYLSHQNQCAISSCLIITWAAFFSLPPKPFSKNRLQHCIVRTCKSFHVLPSSLVITVNIVSTDVEGVIRMSNIVLSHHHPVCSVPSGHVAQRGVFWVSGYFFLISNGRKLDISNRNRSSVSFS